jgi:hypothetical protein
LWKIQARDFSIFRGNSPAHDFPCKAKYKKSDKLSKCEEINSGAKNFIGEKSKKRKIKAAIEKENSIREGEEEKENS